MHTWYAVRVILRRACRHWARRGRAAGSSHGTTCAVALALPPLAHKVCDALTDHNRRGIGVGANAIRHDRGVRNPQVFQPMHAPVLVHDRHGVRGWPHLTGARDVMGGADVMPQPVIQRLVRRQVSIRW